MREFIINKNDSDQRADKFLSKTVPNLPPNLMYKYFRTKRIKLNGKKCGISTKLSEHDILSLYINDEFFTRPHDEFDFMKAGENLDIVYEDKNIILLDKKSGLLVHEDDENETDTLINRLKRYLYEKGEYDSLLEQSFAPALCNRLDRNTGGIVIAAKNAEALRIINRKIKEREIEKFYLCVTVGIPVHKSGRLTAYLEKYPEENFVRISDKKTPTNKTIITSYKVIKSNGNLALLEILLETGRTHQIRAHMAYIGCPLLGDGKYGINTVNREYKINRQALYSYKLKFSFSSDGDILDYLNGREFKVKKVWFAEEFFPKT